MTTSKLVVMSVWLFAGSCAAQSRPVESEAAKARLEKELRALHAESSFPGASLAVVLPDDRVIAVTVGFASPERRTPLRASDRMMSASIGKTYFAAAALKLIVDRRISLDDRVSKYLGDEAWFKRIPNSDSISTAHLMRHQSGIPRYVLVRQVWQDMLDDPNLMWTPGDQLKYIYDRAPLHPAGSGWAYSDTNYILLGLIMQKVTQTSAYDLVRNDFLRPHGLRDTIPNDSRRLPGLVQGHSTVFKTFGVPEQVVQDGKFVFNPQMEWCGGGFLSTASDLARWAHVYFSGGAFDADYMTLMTEAAADSSAMLGRGSQYGLGVIIRETDLGTLLGHDGGFPGYTATMGYYPKHKIAAALMINADSPGTPKRLGQVMTEMVGRLVDPGP